MKILASLVFFGIAWLVGGWTLMLFIGVIHHEWWPMVPTISYRGALWIEAAAALMAVVAALVGSLLKAVTE
ncbi:hypothetical protein IMZ11_02705 [Microtetraspora sp. AC03309]|uniref:hypothetical protein n=1 Tax=Microtetraspora sp. AC03309 TaxID=2779376 RepID=UPI001E29139B|nr:hypothetical protein [Microtetraspora sp. AC03309]MCC5574550.1 hypothetical protein [Microtetraspora sp. AC03309]